MAQAPNPEEILARFEELNVLEAEFDDVEEELIRKSHALYAPLYKKRAEFIKKIPHFWALVFEQAPPEIDNFIDPSDAKLMGESLETFEVSRFEIDDPKGSPRSFSLTFGFRENEYFENKTLEKKFWFRKSNDWVGYVSEPVKINWKEGKDLSYGLTDAAYELGEARKKLYEKEGLEAKKKERELPEYKALASKIETSIEASLSFFTLFGFVSSYRWISPEESEEADKKEKERLEKSKRGETAEDSDDDEDDDDDQHDWQETEVFPQADEVANLFAEDVWPSAIRYFKQAHETDDDDDEELSELDVMDEDSEDEIDIRALVGKGKKASQSPPAKKQRKA